MKTMDFVDISSPSDQFCECAWCEEGRAEVYISIKYAARDCILKVLL
jgi:hypothetical protein